MTLKLVVELEKAEIVPKKQLSVLVIESLPNKHFIRDKSIDKSRLAVTNDVFIKENLTLVYSRIAYDCRKLKCQNLISKTYTTNGMVHLIGNNIKRGKSVKVLHIQTVLNLFPVEFKVSNNEEEDVNELANESYQSSY